jgi:hypothetical protein
MNDSPKKPFKEGFVDNEIPTELPQETQPEISVEKWPIVVKLLYKTIRNERGESLSELAFREPRGGDINRYGNPVRVNADGDVVIDERRMMMVMAALSGVNMPFLEMMDPRDWNSCAW